MNLINVIFGTKIGILIIKDKGSNHLRDEDVGCVELNKQSRPLSYGSIGEKANQNVMLSFVGIYNFKLI